MPQEIRKGQAVKFTDGDGVTHDAVIVGGMMDFAELMYTPEGADEATILSHVPHKSIVKPLTFWELPPETPAAPATPADTPPVKPADTK